MRVRPTVRGAHHFVGSSAVAASDNVFTMQAVEVFFGAQANSLVWTRERARILEKKKGMNQVGAARGRMWEIVDSGRGGRSQRPGRLGWRYSTLPGVLAGHLTCQESGLMPRFHIEFP